MHPIGSYEVDMGDRKYSFNILQQQSENLLFIQERVVEPTGGYALRGSLLIPLKQANHFFSEIRNFLHNFKQVESGGNQNGHSTNQ